MVNPTSDASSNPAIEVKNLSYRYGGGAEFHTRQISEPKLTDVNFALPAGSRVLVAGANGAGKSTLLSIAGGKKMVPRGLCTLLGKDAFCDTSLNVDRMYCGDWWRTNFFFNLSVSEVIGAERLAKPRAQQLIDILQVDISWRINAISDGQRRRVQLLESLAEEKKFYVMDEITTDLDLFARENLLKFLRQETEEKGCTILYATHIFDSLADWATHCVFFAKGQLVRCCRMEDLTEYHALVAKGTRVPLYTLMKEWVCREYDAPVAIEMTDDVEMAEESEGPAIDVKNLTYSYAAGLPPVLKDISFSFKRGARILVIGANGASKSTVMSILGGKRMISRGPAKILGKDCFNDPIVARSVIYCGDWWSTNFFMNLKISELLGEAKAASQRCRHLADILQVNMEWKINHISDGQRRRCQLLEILSEPRPVYLMDEITSDLDLYAREGILSFLKAESELRGATIFYCTHIFDHLEGWATDLLHLSKGTVVRAVAMDELQEYSQLIAEGCPTPLYNLVRNWIYAEYDADGSQSGVKSWRQVNKSLDGRVPNLGLAGPFQTSCA